MATLSSSQRVFDDENLLTDILLRLPAITLLKLKSVCKRWNSIVSSDPFARLHALLHRANSDPTSGVFLRRLVPSADSNSPNYNYHFLSLPSGPLSRAPFQFRFSLSAPKLLQCCNGLMLFSVARHENSYCIYNPATYQFKALPNLTLAAPARVLGVSLAFDPSRFEGFRVFCVATTETSGYTYRIFSYVSSGGSWKEWEGNPFNAPFDVVFSSGVYWNGAFHWISLREDSVYFDLERDKLRRFPSPPISPRKRGYRQFCEFNGNLHYLDGDEFRTPVCKIFGLMGYNEGWILKYSVYVPEMVIGEVHGFSMLCLVCNESKEGGKRRLEMVYHMRRKILAYDLEKKSWRTICGLESGDCMFASASFDRLEFGWFDACTYTATLALF